VGVTRGGVVWRSRDSYGPIKNLCNRTLLFTLLSCHFNVFTSVHKTARVTL